MWNRASEKFDGNGLIYLIFPYNIFKSTEKDLKIT